MSTGNGKHKGGWRILIAGTGGQGVLTAARLLCESFVEQGREVVSGQLHGMAQRGGSVQSSILIDSGISPVIADGCATCVLGFEPVETARALAVMSSDTVVYVNTAPVIPYVLGQRSAFKREEAEYPDVDSLLTSIRRVTPRTYALDATELAIEAGSARTLNLVMLGCLVGSGLLPCTVDYFWHSVVEHIPAALAKKNADAFFRGVEWGRRNGEGGMRKGEAERAKGECRIANSE